MDFFAQLPALPVVVPFVAAPLALLMPPGRMPWLWATLVSWVSFGLSLLLLEQVWINGPITYAMGGWAAPLGIIYYIDLANALVLSLVTGIAAVVFPYAYNSVRDEINHSQTPGFYTALLLCLAGLIGVTMTGDAFNVFVFLEVSSLATYTLVAMGAGRDRRALTAAFNYLVMGTIGATFFVIGIGLLYQATGTLNMLDLHERLAGQDNRLVKAAFAFIITGLGLKLAMLPLHLWLPPAYTYAPSAITAFLAATATKVAVYIMLRFLFTVFGFDFPFLRVALDFFLVLGIAGMFIASLAAVFQDDVKMLLAYSSVAQIGYMLLGISLGTVDGVAASLIHVVNHAFIKAALFMAVGIVVLRLGSHQLRAFQGLATRMPWTSWGIVVAGLSLVGVPATVGFVSKYALLSAVFAKGGTMEIIAGFLILASSLLAVVYMMRIIKVMLEPVPTEGPFARNIAAPPLMMRLMLWIMVGANIYFGLQAQPVIAIAQKAAATLLGVDSGEAF